MAFISLRLGCLERRMSMFLLSLFVLSAQLQASDELAWIRPGDDGLSDLVASPTGTTLYSAARSPHIKKWDLASQTFDTWFASLQDCEKIDISPDGQVIASAGRFALSFRSASTGRLLASESLSGSGPRTVDYAPSGAFVLVSFGSASEPFIQMTSVASMAPVRYYGSWMGQGVNDIAISPDSRNFVASADYRLTFWRISAGRPYFTHPERTYSADFSADGTLLVTGHERGKVIVWHYPTATQLRVLVGDRNAVARKVAFDDATGNVLSLQSNFNDVSVPSHLFGWGHATYQQVFATQLEGGARALAAPTQGNLIFAGTYFGGAVAIDRATGSVQRQLTSDKGRPDELRFTPGGGDVVSSSIFPNYYRAVHADTGDLRWTTRSSLESWGAMALSSDGSRMVAADGLNLKIVNADTGAVLQTIPHGNPIRSVAFMPNSDIIAYADAEPNPDKITVRSLSAGQLASIELAPYENYGDIEFTPDGTRLIVSLGSGWLRIYRTNDWQPSHTAQYGHHGNWGCEFAVSPDNSLIAVEAWQEPFRGVRLVRTSDLSEVLRISGPQRPDLEFSADGQVLWVGSDRLQAYRVSDGQLLYTSSHPEIRRVARIAISPSTGDIAFYRGDGSQGVLRNPLR